MKTVEEYFLQSISHYQLLVEEATVLATELQSLSPNQILEKCSNLQKIQQEIAENDAHIVEIMNFMGPEVLDNPYTGEYQRTIQKAIDATAKVSSRAKGMRAFLSAEIQKVKTSMNTIENYSSKIKHTGGTLRSEA